MKCRFCGIQLRFLNLLIGIHLNTRDAQTCIISFTGFLLNRMNSFLPETSFVFSNDLQLSKLLTKLTLTGAAWQQRNQNRGLFYSCVSPRAYQLNARSTGKIHLGNRIENRILSNFIFQFRNSLKPFVKFIPVFVV